MPTASESLCGASGATDLERPFPMFAPAKELIKKLFDVFGLELRENGPFRQIHVYTTPQQRKSLALNLEPQLSEREQETP